MFSDIIEDCSELREKYGEKIKQYIADIHWNERNYNANRDCYHLLDDDVSAEYRDYYNFTRIDILITSFDHTFKQYFSEETGLQISPELTIEPIYLLDFYDSILPDIIHLCKNYSLPKLTKYSLEYFHEMRNLYQKICDRIYSNCSICTVCGTKSMKNTLLTFSCNHKAHLVCALEVCIKNDGICKFCDIKVSIKAPE
jgi:hypothetical protein